VKDQLHLGWRIGQQFDQVGLKTILSDKGYYWVCHTLSQVRQGDRLDWAIGVGGGLQQTPMERQNLLSVAGRPLRKNQHFLVLVQGLGNLFSNLC